MKILEKIFILLHLSEVIEMAKRTKSLERYFYSLDYEKKIKSKLTRKQFAIYTYLLYLSNWNSIEGENHYYVYRNSFNIK